MVTYKIRLRTTTTAERTLQYPPRNNQVQRIQHIRAHLTKAKAKATKATREPLPPKTVLTPLRRLNVMAPRSSQFSDISTPCPRRSHCPLHPPTCTRRHCISALTSRLERRHLTLTTKTNTLNPVMTNIRLQTQDIRTKCDRRSWHIREINGAYARYAEIMRRVVKSPRCGCVSCRIWLADRKIELLGLQYKEARRYSEVLERFRWEWDLEAAEKNKVR